MEIRSLEAIFSALNEASARYIVVGGLAVNVHGYERLTRDLDLVIGLEEHNISRALRALFAIGYQPAIPLTVDEFANAANRDRWQREKNMIVLKLWSDLHRRTPIDVFIQEPFDFEAEDKLAERMELAPGLVVPFVTCGTLLSMKRAAGRPQDLADIAAIEELRNLSNNEPNGRS